MPIITNELKKGDMVRLRNGFKARVEDNKRGNIRLCTVFGDFTEIGSVYSHNIMVKLNDGGYDVPVLHTPKQLECKALCSSMGF